MIVTLNWLKDFVDINESPEKIAELYELLQPHLRALLCPDRPADKEDECRCRGAGL